LKIIITGICGFVGSTLARSLVAEPWVSSICGIDNLSRRGGERNLKLLANLGIRVIHGDIRFQSDVDCFPVADWVIDAAANPSVLAGIDGKTSSRQLVEHNLLGTINLLEYCKGRQAGFCLLSTSRVYSIPGLASLRMQVVDNAFLPDPDQEFPVGVSINGISEGYSTDPPVSLYGSTKVTSEHLALEYGSTFGFPVWINRCGVMAGAGQFGHPAQGILAYWIHSFREGKPLQYIGFGGNGYQVRDCLHPRDLVHLFKKQFAADQRSLDQNTETRSRIYNLSGGTTNSISLLNLSAWCERRYGMNAISRVPDSRQFDIPWVVLDSSQANRERGWSATIKLEEILQEIADFADRESDWLALSMS
jgi:CDP-paratose 2-epimerase